MPLAAVLLGLVLAEGPPQPTTAGAPAAAREPGPLAPLPRLARVRRGAALLTLAVPTLATGAALVVLRGRSFDRYLGSCALGPDQPLCSEAGIVDQARHVAAGAGLVGAGLGLVATGVTAALPVRRRVWLAEALAGGAALVLGAAWLGAENLAYSRAVADDYVARVGPWADRRTVAASLLGAGLGLALGAGVGLLPPSRRARQVAWTPWLALAGVGVQARF